jgi:glycosyltransferase involved in cell wall biosynthesis
LRIAINTRFLVKGQLEGIGWYTSEVLQRLVQQRPEHQFLFLFDKNFDQAFVFAENVTPVVLFPPARHPFLWWWWFEISIPWALKKYKADVFLSPDGYASLRAPVPTVMVVHDIAYKYMRHHFSALMRSYFDYYVPKFVQKAQRIVTVSEFSKQDIIKQLGVSPDKIAVSYNGCKDNFKPLNESDQAAVRLQYAEDQAYFLYVGSIHPRKNVHRLIQAFDQFKIQTQSPVKLLIGGRFAWQTGEVKDAYDQAIFKRDIQLLGYVSDQELPRLVGAALALVYVSLFEGFGVPLLEAMFCEVPIITSNVSAMPEVAGEAAWLVDPTDVNAIANAMQLLYENPELREDLIEKGKMQRKKFTWEQATAIIWENIKLAAQSKDYDKKT